MCFAAKKFFILYPSPGPLARATLSRWERDLPQNFTAGLAGASVIVWLQIVSK
jgi:hypothetical protein